MAVTLIDPVGDSKADKISGLITNKTTLLLSNKCKTLDIRDNKEKSFIQQLYFKHTDYYKGIIPVTKTDDFVFIYTGHPYFAGVTMQNKFINTEYFKKENPVLQKKIAEKSLVEEEFYMMYYNASWQQHYPEQEECLAKLKYDCEKTKQIFIENYGTQEALAIHQLVYKNLEKKIRHNFASPPVLVETPVQQLNDFNSQGLQPNVA